jgi:hypothetical protein
MTHPHDRALEAAARALFVHSFVSETAKPHFRWEDVGAGPKRNVQEKARAAVTAYQAAMPPPVSPELIAKLNALASRLTQMGEYEAVDLIDTVVARVIDAAPPAAQEPRP